MDVARQCLGYLVAHLEAEAGAIEIQIELVVLVKATEARGVQRYFQGKVVESSSQLTVALLSVFKSAFTPLPRP